MSDGTPQVALPLDAWRVVAHVLHRTSRWDVGAAFDIDPRELAKEIETQVYDWLAEHDKA